MNDGVRGTQAGMTLVELVIAIAVAAIAVAALASSFANIGSHTADPMIQTQGLISAEALMDEILLKPFLDPDDGSNCQVGTPAANTRPNFDNLCDYDAYTTRGIFDEKAVVIAGLAAYDVAVTVVPTVLGSITAADALLVTVTMTLPTGNDLVLSAYRTNY